MRATHQNYATGPVVRFTHPTRFAVLLPASSLNLTFPPQSATMWYACRGTSGGKILMQTSGRPERIVFFSRQFWPLSSLPFVSADQKPPKF